MTAPTLVLTLLAPKEIEERLTDVMLDHAPTATAGFTSREINGHGAAAAYRNVAEQIRGRTRLIELTVVANKADADGLIAHIAEALPGRGITYQTGPLGSAGIVG